MPAYLVITESLQDHENDNKLLASTVQSLTAFEFLENNHISVDSEYFAGGNFQT